VKPALAKAGRKSNTIMTGLPLPISTGTSFARVTDYAKVTGFVRKFCQRLLNTYRNDDIKRSPAKPEEYKNAKSCPRAELALAQAGDGERGSNRSV